MRCPVCKIMSEYSDWSDAMVLAEIEILSDRYYDLLDEITEARLAKAALLNALQSKKTTQEGGHPT